MKHLRPYTLILVCLFILQSGTQAQWSLVKNGLTSVRINALAVSGTNLFAATDSGGVFLSPDNGSSWTAVNAGLSNTTVWSLLAAGNFLFAGTNDGVFLSTNNGSTWTAKNSGLKGIRVNALATSGATLFAGTWRSGGVYYSSDNGTTWTAASSGVTNWCVWSLAVSGTKIFAGNGDLGVYVSTDNGVNWSAANDGLTAANVMSFAVCGTNLFAGTLGDGVFLSTDNGAKWTAVNDGLTNINVRALASSTNSPGGLNLIAGTDGGVFLSTNNGCSWTFSNNGPNAAPRALAVSPNWSSGTNLFAGTNTGVWKYPLRDWAFLIAPQDRIGGISSGVTFVWKKDPRALAYAFQISTTPEFEHTVVDRNSADTAYTVSDLLSNTVYYWRVRSENTTWESEWGTRQFTTRMTGAPELLTPQIGAMLVSVRPQLSWSGLVSTASYTVEVSTRSSFDTKVFSQNTSSTSLIASQLEGSTLYHWRVRAQTVGDTTAWSAPGFFRTLPDAPPAVALIYPDSGSQNVFQNDWLLWKPDAAASSYTVQISNTPLFSAIYDSATTSSPGYRSSNKQFSPGTLYFWRVRSTGWGGAGQFSPVWSFRTGNDSRKAFALYSLQSIDFGRVRLGEFRDTIVAISNNGNDTLKIRSTQSSDPAFKVIPGWASIPPGQSLSFGPIRFAPTSGDNRRGNIAFFTNAPNSSDTITVSGFAVSYGLKLSSKRIDLGPVPPGTWKDTTITIANTGSDTLKITGIGTLLEGITMSPTSCHILPGSSATDTIRIVCLVSGAISGSIVITSNAPSSPDSIRISATGVPVATGIAREGIPASFRLNQNYPNPFNPSTTISYELPEGADVTLKVFNALGQEVASLVNGMYEAGYYKVTWSARVSSGVYYYRLQAGDFVENRKMILLR